MQKRRLGTILILLGALLLAGALGLLGYNQWDNGRAQKAAAQVLDQLETTLDEQENHLQLLVPTQVDDTAREMTVTAIDGWDYIGYLSIPSIGLALPVMSEWSYPGLKIAPGRYAGSVFTDDLVICGHNYARHFSPVKRLAVGTTVQFVDMDGREWDYTVSKVETLQPTQIEEMVGKADGDDWDLTLFTCTTGGGALYPGGDGFLKIPNRNNLCGYYKKARSLLENVPFLHLMLGFGGDQ